MLIPEKWRDYELVDTGDGEKLERWGDYVVARPDSRIIWNKGNPEIWNRADAIFENENWKFRTQPPSNWMISYEPFVKFKLRPTDFKHTGVFPEQAVNWEWLSERFNPAVAGQDSKYKVLNLFAYTGGATMAAANAGAHVTHVDASKPVMMWAGENAKLSGTCFKTLELLRCGRWMTG